MTVGNVVAFDDLADLGGTVLSKHRLFPGSVGRDRVGRKTIGLEPRVLLAETLLQVRGQIREGEALLVTEMALEAAIAIGYAILEGLAGLATDGTAVHPYMLPDPRHRGIRGHSRDFCVPAFPRIPKLVYFVDGRRPSPFGDPPKMECEA